MDTGVLMVSGHARAGKDTVTQMLIERFKALGFKAQRFAFADELKALARVAGWDGTKEGDGRWFLIDCGQILRRDYIYSNGLMVLATEPSTRVPDRDSYDVLELFTHLTHDMGLVPQPNFFVDHVRKQIPKMDLDYAIVSDWRFPNERRCMAEAFPRLLTVRVNNPRALSIDDPSETSLDDFDFDIFISNDGTLEDLGQGMDTLVSAMMDAKKVVDALGG